MSFSINISLRTVPLILCVTIPLAYLPARGETNQSPAEDPQVQATINTLNSLIALQGQLKKEMESLDRELNAARTPARKKEIQGQLGKLEADLQATGRNLQETASGADMSSLRATKEPEFNLQEEIFALLKPALQEMKDVTRHVRMKADLKDKIAYYQERLPVVQEAVANIAHLLESTKDPVLEKHLKRMLGDWRKQSAFMESELQSAELQLEKLESSEASLAEASQSYLKGFFQKRGLYLTQALLVVLGILLISRLGYKAMVRLIPGYRREHRSFRVRLLDLAHRILTVLLTIIGPMVVFYVAEDWVLFSLGILLLLGIGLTIRHALPRYFHQAQVFLNIGPVREGERIFFHGLPWRIRSINLFSILENPTADLVQRVPIDDLLDLRSHPIKKDEPWFPCQRDDWVLLGDGTRGKVTGISPELVRMVQRGGTHRTYTTADFLAQSPLNLSTNFRLKETIGISYDLQKESVTTIPDILKGHIEKRVAEESYGDRLLNLRVEFQQANTSSLDLVVIADFDGDVADLYNRLRRAIQRWCVEACTENHWEIPFTQLTLHRGANADPNDA
uniref:Uncharacterized protein n=1 Tax=Candidatus Kentrum sp. DK TaxID=2126562 RepID=A0A450RTV8_9GAMM|nr:MAG: hypothetical protein BECKDK2373C_GA0170839_100166 [Candidatus Kentron sp. DK]